MHHKYMSIRNKGNLRMFDIMYPYMLGKSNEYLLQFTVPEGLLFADLLVMHSYGKFGVVEIYNDGILREYNHKDARIKTYSLGLELYSSQEKTDSFFSSLQSRFDHIFEDYEKILLMGASTEMLHKFINLSKEIIYGYTLLSPLFTDRLFKDSKHNAILSKNLREINKRKDLFRTKISALYFEKNNFLLKLRMLFSKKFTIPAEDLRWYTVDDLEKLFDNIFVSKKDITARKLAFIQIGSENGIENIYGQKALEIIREFDSYSKPTESILKGTVACISSRPIVQGFVRIINANYKNPEDVKRKIQLMKKGEILVAQTTSPNRMAACMKAGAVITDVGGVLSHAAIISREFDIPCIVGTEFASKVLKDGDLVEVNTTKGTIALLRN